MSDGHSLVIHILDKEYRVACPPGEQDNRGKREFRSHFSSATTWTQKTSMRMNIRVIVQVRKAKTMGLENSIFV